MALEEGLQLLTSAIQPASTPPTKANGWAKVTALEPLTVVLEDDSDETELYVASNAAGPLEEGYRVWVTFKENRLTTESSPELIEKVVSDALQGSLDAEAAKILAEAANQKAITAQTIAEEALTIGENNSGAIVNLGEDVDAAQQAADDAAAAAAQATTTADGASSVLVGVSAPTTRRNGSPLKSGDLWYRTDPTDPTQIIQVNTWNETTGEWVPRQIVADSVLVPSSIGAVLIKDGAVTAPKIAVDALDFKTAKGMILTASTVQTDEAADVGVKLTPTGFIAYGADGTPTATINGTSGAFSGYTFTGGLIQTTAEANRGIKLTSGGFVAYNAAGNVTASINAAGGAFTGYTISGGTITGALLQTRSGATEGIKIDSAGAYFYDDGSTNRGTISFYLCGNLSSRLAGNGMRFWYDNAESATVTSGSAGLDLWSKYWVSSDAPEVGFSGNLFNVTSNKIVLGDVTGAESLRIDAYTWTAAFNTLTFQNSNGAGLTVGGTGVASLRGTTARVEVGTDVILRTDASLYIRKTASNVSPLSPSYRQAASPLMLDGNGRMYEWNNAPQRPVTVSSAFPMGTTWTAGQVRTWTASYSATSPSGDIRDVLVNFTNFPGGSANLNIRRGAFSATSCTVYVVNTGAATTLGGDLSVQVSVLV